MITTETISIHVETKIMPEWGGLHLPPKPKIHSRIAGINTVNYGEVPAFQTRAEAPEHVYVLVPGIPKPVGIGLRPEENIPTSIRIISRSMGQLQTVTDSAVVKYLRKCEEIDAEVNKLEAVLEFNKSCKWWTHFYREFPMLRPEHDYPPPIHPELDECREIITRLSLLDESQAREFRKAWYNRRIFIYVHNQ